MLVGPFNLPPKVPGRAGNQLIDDKIWEQLSVACHHHGLVPPDLSFDPATCVNTVGICQDSRSVPWYQSSIMFSEAVHRCL